MIGAFFYEALTCKTAMFAFSSNTSLIAYLNVRKVLCCLDPDDGALHPKLSCGPEYTWKRKPSECSRKRSLSWLPLAGRGSCKRWGMLQGGSVNEPF
jgi:hypothetical protein